MTNSNRLMAGAAAAALVLGLATGGPAAAQTAPGQGHDTHHPDGVTPTSPAPVPGPAQQRGMPGMMGGQGMQMPGGPGGQSGGAAGTMGGDMGRMMQMMHQRMAAQHAARPFERIEGQLAFYRAELRVTDAQRPQWDAFADAVRAAAGTLRQAVTQGMQQGTAGGPVPAPEQMERRIALLSTQADAMRSVQAAAGPLYAALSDEQKRTADTLMAEHLRGMGGMRMMGGI